ncbi:MAG: hypothetical protein WED82_11300 [Balneolales bacterium]
MIPARLGSERLKQKNLLCIKSVPLIVRALRKTRDLGIFSEVWANSDAKEVGELAAAEGVYFHKRPIALSLSTASSEDYVYEFLKAHPCEYLIQIHSIAPLLTADEIRSFTKELVSSEYDTLLSGVNEQIQCMIQEKPLNFSNSCMDATQDLIPIQRITWSITGWRASSYIKTREAGHCATFNGKLGFFNLSRPSGMVIKYEEDFLIIKALAEAGIGE